MGKSTAGPVSIRRATPDDVPASAQICYDAFRTISERHGFEPDIPSPEVAGHIFSMMFSRPDFYCVVAEADGHIIGSNCLDERSSIAGVGPITIDPKDQNRGIGRQLMQAVLDRAQEQKFAGVRLVQAAFHNRSLSLYTALGFRAREPLSVLNGPPIRKEITGTSVRPVQSADIESCDRVCRDVHGHDRHGEIVDAVGRGSARLVERDGRITGYVTALAFFGHAVSETNRDIQALIASAEDLPKPGFLLPTRNTELLRWSLENGLRIQQPMTLMSIGLYNEPAGAYLASITF